MTGTPYIWRSRVPELGPFPAGQRRFICRVAMKLLRRDDFYFWGFVQVFGLGWIALWGLITMKVCANATGVETLVLAATPLAIGVLGLQMRAHILYTRIRPIIEEIVARHADRIHAIRARFGFRDSVACSVHVARHLIRTIRLRTALPFIAFALFVGLIAVLDRPYVFGAVEVRLAEPGYLATNRQTSERIGFVRRLGSDNGALLIERRTPRDDSVRDYVALRQSDGELLGEFSAEALQESPFAKIELMDVVEYSKRKDSASQ